MCVKALATCKREKLQEDTQTAGGKSREAASLCTPMYEYFSLFLRVLLTYHKHLTLALDSRFDSRLRQSQDPRK